MLHSSVSQPLKVGERIFVDCKADLIFNFGCAYQRQMPTIAGQGELITRSNFDAPRDYPVLIAQHGEVHLIGVRFKPGGISAFSSIPVNELKNQVIDLVDMFDQQAVELEGRLFDALSHSKKQIALVEQFLLQRLSLTQETELAFQVAQRIKSARNKISIRELSQESGYSSRHLNRIYQHTLGVSPKFHTRVTRFHQVLAHLIAQPDLKPLDFVERGEYYDQSHLAKDFLQFTGQTMRQYRTYLLEKRNQPAPNLVRFLQEK